MNERAMTDELDHRVEQIRSDTMLRMEQRRTEKENPEREDEDSRICYY